MKRAWSLLALAAVGSYVFANVDLRTNIQNIYYRGTCEEAGTVTMSVNGNDFLDASTLTPVFIRVTLDKGGKLCNTLVTHLGDTNTALNRLPIYLAMRLEGFVNNTTVSADPESVSIVRWKKGEPELWLRVQTASNTWLSNPAFPTTYAPNQNERVAWTFGITARASWIRNNPLYLVGTANLPYNTWDVVNAAGGTTGWAISTLFCVDVSKSILTPQPELNSELNFDTISYLGAVDEDGVDTGTQTVGVRTQSSYTTIRLGDQSAANFSGDDTIARGNPLSCTWTVTGKCDTGYAALCQQSAGYQGTPGNLVCIDGCINIKFLCSYGLRNGSYFYITTPKNFGFYINPQTDQIQYEPYWSGAGATDWLVDYDVEDVFVDGGMTFAWRVKMTYTGADIVSGSITRTLNATVCMYYDNEPTEATVTLTGFLANIGSEFDLDPDLLFYGLEDDGDEFDGITAWDQRKRCPRSFVTLPAIEWPIGEFGECLSDEVSIFFPYLPKLVGTDWYVGFGVVNQGFCPFSDGETQARIYESNGNLWTFDLPALPVRGSQTYLLADGDQGVGLYGDAGSFIAPQTSTTDLVLGDVRSSMFIVAQHAANTTADIAGPDIDGFALVGNNVTLESFGYLPRNFVAAGQAQTMPLRTRKQ